MWNDNSRKLLDAGHAKGKVITKDNALERPRRPAPSGRREVLQGSRADQVIGTTNVRTRSGAGHNPAPFSRARPVQILRRSLVRRIEQMLRRSRVSGNPATFVARHWVPAFAGTTMVLQARSPNAVVLTRFADAADRNRQGARLTFAASGPASTRASSSPWACTSTASTTGAPSSPGRPSWTWPRPRPCGAPRPSCSATTASPAR